MSKFGAIILAAGLSRRMGTVNKLLIDIDGEPMIRRSVRPYLNICDGEIVVVTGHAPDRVEQALADLPVRFVHNPNFAQGQKTSVAAGLTAIAKAEQYFVGLGDQPFLTSADLTAFAAHAGETKITVAYANDKRGNPLIVPHGLKPALLADRSNPGCQKFTRNNPDKVNRVAVGQPAFFHDLDTPEAINALQTGKEPIICAV